MRVAIVSQPFDSVLPPDQNSIGIWTYEVARRLGDRCDTTVFAKSMSHARRAGHAGSLVVDDVTYRYVRVLPNGAWGRLGARVERFFDDKAPFFASSLYHADFAARVAIALRRSRFDIVHIHNFTGFVPIIRAANPGAKLVLHMNGEWLSQLEYGRMDARISKVDMVFGSSDHITTLVTDRFPHHASKCHTVYNGVDVGAFAPRYSGGDDRPATAEADGAPLLLFVGRISPEKGLHDLIDAFSIVAGRHPGARLEIVGPSGAIPREFIVDVSDDEMIAGLARFYDGDYTEHLRQRVPPQLRSQVSFTGPMSHDAVVEHVARATVLVNPSYSESFGMSLVEAMASEVPVVATRVGGMKEIVADGVTGQLVERGDIEGLADAIGGVVSDAARRESMGRAGRERVLARFSWDAVADAAMARYRQLTGEAR